MEQLQTELPAWQIREESGLCVATHGDIRITAETWDELRDKVTAFIALSCF